MAEDKDSKTEDATPKRRREAEEKGQMPHSQEVNNVVSLTAGLIVVIGLGRFFMPDIAGRLQAHIQGFGTMSTGPESLRAMAADLVIDTALIMAVPMTIFVAAALIGNLLQKKVVLTGERLKPDLKKIDPIKGFKQKFGTQALVEFAKTMIKLPVIFGVILLVLYPARGRLQVLMDMPIGETLAVLALLIARVLIAVILVMVLIAILDLVYQRWKHSEDLKMSKQEVKDERKQTEGDPEVKRKLAQLRAQRGRERMMAAVPDADVVVTNPTHFAVALRYKHGEMDAPVLVAKGVDQLALRIRSVAEEHGVPVMENPPVARALYAAVEVDEEIPPAHYQAVAEVIGYVMRLKAKTGRSRRRADAAQPGR
ncbi:flagellar biosynthesis protein FlhB [Rhodothalassium salexigens]|uniref:flagellar biosynthesis protein FlhB n=1 Tax=Rhodothalassium salexigens TaxID=1086 RepID=UPI0019144FCE|nr:flagellar biosynthesis protein FlhB [Rhodothalassium salexigens]MBK5910488.1 flagellar biosynthesis protein FlhB [Rhodothalassium salexigens]MBK5921694.1 flagellar biosynthesis protein FlhB [Rhodothalassium salexigens]